jgi:hypothetical protein
VGIPGIDRIAAANWVIVATDYSFAEKGGPLPYLIGEGEARAALDSSQKMNDELKSILKLLADRSALGAFLSDT